MYSSSYIDHNASEEAPLSAPKLEKLIADLSQARPGRIADWGCGPGQELRALINLNFDAVGFEFSDSMVNAVDGEDAPVRNISQANLYQSQFDWILLNDVLEHVPRPSHVLELISTIATKDAILRIDSPLEGSLNLFSELLKVNAWIRRRSPVDSPPFHLHLFNLQSLRVLLDLSGWTIIRVETYQTHWPAPATLKRAVAEGRAHVVLWLAQQLSMGLVAARLGSCNRVIIHAQRTRG